MKEERQEVNSMPFIKNENVNGIRETNGSYGGY